MTNATIKDGLDGFITELNGGLEEGSRMTAGEQTLLELGHYNGAVTVLGILEDLLLSDEPAAQKLGRVTALLAEASQWSRSKLGLIGKHQRDDARLRADILRQGADATGAGSDAG
jgi:hypothetical protein